MGPDFLPDVSNAAGFASSLEGRVLDSLMLGVTVHDHHGRLIHWNEPARELLQPTRSSDDVAEPDVPAPTLRFTSGVLVIDAFHPTTTALRYGRDVIDVGMRAVWPDGMSVALLVTAQVVPDLVVAGESAVVTTYLPDRESVEWREAAVRRSPACDSATGVLNRRGLQEAVREIREAPGGRERALGCLWVAVDHFKQVNDELGHFAGDAVLLQLVGRILDVAATPHLVARFGGDEFVVLLVDVAQLDEAAATAEELRVALRQPVVCLEVDAVTVVTSSIGATKSAPDEDLDHMLHRADVGAFKAKRDGGDRVVVVPAPSPG